MTVTTILAYLIIAVTTLCIVYFATRMVRPLLRPLQALGEDSDSLVTRVFPLLAFICMLSILIKLTLF